MAHEIEKEDNKKRESEEMIKYESSDGELEIKDKNTNSWIIVSMYGIYIDTIIVFSEYIYYSYKMISFERC